MVSDKPPKETVHYSQSSDKTTVCMTLVSLVKQYNVKDNIQLSTNSSIFGLDANSCLSRSFQLMFTEVNGMSAV